MRSVKGGRNVLWVAGRRGNDVCGSRNERGWKGRKLEGASMFLQSGRLRRGFSTNLAGGGYLQTGSHPALDGLDNSPRILVTGAVGQIGSELTIALRSRYGRDNVIASDIKIPPKNFSAGPFLFIDVESRDNLARVVLENRIDWIIHLASLLSAMGERNPQLAMKLNTRGIENVLEIARINNLRVFAPSTIAVFGTNTPKHMTPDFTIMRPSTIYGVTKVYLELLGEYYFTKYGVDFRSIRYPGIISSLAMPGGGTTDYAVEIYHEALKNKSYKCFLREDSRMPMLYMPDCIAGTISLLDTPISRLRQRVYNITGFSFTPKEVADSIKKYIPEFSIHYKPDFRQEIADSWPQSIDDSAARRDWDWKPEYDLDGMTNDMLKVLTPKYKSDKTPSSPKQDHSHEHHSIHQHQFPRYSSTSDY